MVGGAIQSANVLLFSAEQAYSLLFHSWEGQLEHPPRAIKQDQLLNFIFESLQEAQVVLTPKPWQDSVMACFLAKSSGFGLPITCPFPGS